ncbi:hypothetical protein GCM10010912_31330 [Paenibacillus albidus]|uniref:Uncharacterized protein n=1 Tax=Paenibacillus albidus TaxID=2041023 RepID=A0A917FHP8_9BACL|nr:hypothetical protein GCM10010912_31330 [Paenibacillus albidus]
MDVFNCSNFVQQFTFVTKFVTNIMPPKAGIYAFFVDMTGFAGKTVQLQKMTNVQKGGGEGNKISYF